MINISKSIFPRRVEVYLHECMGVVTFQKLNRKYDCYSSGVYFCSNVCGHLFNKLYELYKQFINMC